MRETFVAIVIALLLLYFLTKSQYGSQLFLLVKGSTASN